MSDDQMRQALEAGSQYVEAVLADLEQAVFEIAGELGGPEYRARLAALPSPPDALNVLTTDFPGAHVAVYAHWEKLGLRRRRRDWWRILSFGIIR